MKKHITNDNPNERFFNPEIPYRGIGIDIAKNFLSVCSIDDDGVIEYRAKMSHEQLIQELASVKPVRLVMEPCSGSASLAESLRQIGHHPVLVSGAVVHSAVQSHFNSKKNDRNDATVMAQMACQPLIAGAVIPKTEKERRLASILAQRNTLIKMRTEIISSCKGRFLEIGVRLNRAMLDSVEIEREIPEDDAFSMQMISMDRHVVSVLDELIGQIDQKIEAMLTVIPEAKTLMSIPGFGPITTATFLSVIIDPTRFARGSSLCAYLGMVPSENSSGGKIRLGHISRRGNKSLRKQMVISGMALMKMARAKKSKMPDCRLKQWVMKRMTLAGSKDKLYPLKAAVACGCKLLRIALSLLKTGGTFKWETAAVSSR